MGSDGTYGPGVYNVFGVQHYLQVTTDGSVRVVTAEERDTMESGDLVTPTATPQGLPSDALEGITFTNEQRYLDAYWTWIHTLYPVVHKRTFNMQAASPLLRASMFALGAHLLQNSTDMSNARILHERCMKTLKRRNIDGSHTFRVCDLQAIVLTEVYSVFKARRPPLQFSKTFVEVYGRLANDSDALNPDLDSMQNDSPMPTQTVRSGEVFDEFLGFGFVNLDTKCTQRLLFVCYILDQQHATLFGRPRCINTPGLHLPFPGPQLSWDAPHDQQAGVRYQSQRSDSTSYGQVFHAFSDVPTLTEVSETPHDAFQSSLMMACLADPNIDPQSCGFVTDDSVDLSPLLFAVEQSPRVRLAYHTYMLCKDTPIRDLLAVAGESWCMAEKLSSQADYTASQIEAREWARGLTEPSLDTSRESHQWPVERALYHARQIMDIHRQHPKTGLLFQEWAIYLAAVVFWARTYVVGSEPRRKPRLSIPSPTEPRLSAQELERTVTAVIDGGAAAIGWKEAKSVLLWVKAKIERVDMPHNCGLTNSALDVLGKLATRGHEEGWFGT
ncbi:hypothetical protein LTR36_010952 [Oleoguttula mirabilis]|uniref:Xylanolytic transcriptional activator regulatory domain-containing protein n=1 Tax=Oleoguttula mirabilis TaxID=1507867 RepID=A0AAV9J3E6_9PEZI|nr:hypothetical protein LTR36_010952 [Oleoguttula mirabilis]